AAPSPKPLAKAPAAMQPVGRADRVETPAWKVPASISAKGAGAEESYRLVFEAVTDQLARLAKIRAAEGRVGSLLRMIAGGGSDAEILAALPSAPTDRQTAIAVMWDCAVDAVCGDRLSPPASATAPEDPEPKDAARKRMLAVANSSVFVGNEATALNLLTR